MEIKDIIDFEYKLIPDEYVDQILQLIQSNDENNWNLVYQLMCGFEDIDEWHIEYYFKRMMYNYRKYLYEKKQYNNRIWQFTFNKKFKQ